MGKNTSISDITDAAATLIGADDAVARAAEIQKTVNKGLQKNLVTIFGDDGSRNVEAISTGLPTLDYVIGVGGLPRGRIIEIYGPESSGKTSVALRFVATAQSKGFTCAYVDVEHALDPAYMEKIGVRLDELLITQPDSAEEALDAVERLVTAGAALVILDSVAALVPQKELDGDIGDTTVGLQARLMSQALRRLKTPIAQHNAVVVFINQIRQKIGISYGNNETTPGGNALKFYASVRLDIRRIGPVKEGTEIVGSRVRVRAVKNKVAPPFRQTELDLRFAYGLDPVADLVEFGINKKVVSVSGAWYSLAGEKFQGRAALLDAVRRRSDLRRELEEAL